MIIFSTCSFDNVMNPLRFSILIFENLFESPKISVTHIANCDASTAENSIKGLCRIDKARLYLESLEFLCFLLAVFLLQVLSVDLEALH